MQRTADSFKLALGDKAPYFSLKATDSKIYSLRVFADSKALCVIFTCNHCPYAQAYEKRLIDIALAYAPKNIRFVAICSNDADGYPEDSFERMVEKSQTLGFPFPYLHDEKQIAARAYDAACTPEAYVFDGEQRLVYHGSIDDNHKEPAEVKAHYLRDALDAILSERQPEIPLTGCLGCSIKWKD
ncbi:MAG: thioredoxin family protein [Deltaproteobacteria bacterium]|nr:thioredoxin family protein [Deltaproteobacteria bacterium]